MVSSQGRSRASGAVTSGPTNRPIPYRQDRKPRVQRIGAVALLLVDREQHIERGGEEEQRAHHHAAPEARDGEQSEVEQRAASAGRHAALEPDEGDGEKRYRGQHDERPGRPALLAALRQRQHQAGQRQRHQYRTADVEPAATAGAGLRYYEPGGQHHRDRDRQLGEEYGAPAPIERAPFDQCAAGELADRGSEPHHDAVEAERLGKLRFAREQRTDRT